MNCVAPALVAGAILLIAVADTHAQSSLTSNRPGIGDSEALVDRGSIQIESGVQLQDAPPDSDRVWTQTWGQLVIRAGVGPRFEIFAGWDGLSLDRTQADGASQIIAGGNDLRVGFKLAVLSEERHHITVTLAPAWSFPVGAAEFSSGSSDGSLRLMWAGSLPRNWSVGGNLVSAYTSDEAGRYLDNGVMAGLTRALTPSLSAFGEVTTALLTQRSDTWSIDGGLAWVSRPNVQWDVSVGRSLHDSDDRWFLSAGITVRKP
jgi:hypothetical protein